MRALLLDTNDARELEAVIDNAHVLQQVIGENPIEAFNSDPVGFISIMSALTVEGYIDVDPLSMRITRFYEQLPLPLDQQAPLPQDQLPPLPQDQLPPLPQDQLPLLPQGQQPPPPLHQLPPLPQGQMPPLPQDHLPPITQDQLPPLPQDQEDDMLD